MLESVKDFDWPGVKKEKSYEDGSYIRHCSRCDENFLGYKYSSTCHQCSKEIEEKKKACPHTSTHVTEGAYTGLVCDHIKVCDLCEETWFPLTNKETGDVTYYTANEIFKLMEKELEKD